VDELADLRTQIAELRRDLDKMKTRLTWALGIAAAAVFFAPTIGALLSGDIARIEHQTVENREMVSRLDKNAGIIGEQIKNVINQLETNSQVQEQRFQQIMRELKRRGPPEGEQGQ
jgi:cell division protein FtsX